MHALIITEPSAGDRRNSALVESVEPCAATAPDLTIAGVLMNRMPATREAAFRHQELVEGQDELGVAVWTEHTIPVRAVVPEALGAQVPVGALAGTRGREVADQYAAIAARLLALDTVTCRRRAHARRRWREPAPQARAIKAKAAAAAAQHPYERPARPSSRPRLPSTVASRGR